MTPNNPRGKPWHERQTAHTGILFTLTTIHCCMCVMHGSIYASIYARVTPLHEILASLVTDGKNLPPPYNSYLFTGATPSLATLIPRQEKIVGFFIFLVYFWCISYHCCARGSARCCRSGPPTSRTPEFRTPLPRNPQPMTGPLQQKTEG